jgi:mono/diheme cytochrome c family protein
MRSASRFFRFVILAGALGLAACDQSGYDAEDEPTPIAVATTLGQAFTTDANGVMSTTVRAGAEVVLSGKESGKGAADTGVPLIKFEWTQTSPGNNPVNVVYRTANTISFTAPQVTEQTTLRFRLVVADAKGKTAATDANVIVLPVRDGDHFLQYLLNPASVAIALATQTPIAGNGAAAVADSMPGVVTLTKLVSFTDRTGFQRSRVMVGQPIVANTSWSARVGTATLCSASQNPTLRVDIPRLDMDDRLTTPLAQFPEATLLADVIEASDIDDVTLEVRIDVASSNLAVQTAAPRVCIGNASFASGTVVTSESLYPTNAQRDSKSAAQAYYATIDPTSSRDTLNKWLVANGFNPAVDGWSADAHAVYTNNYDLGFGRDMYMKFGVCDAGAAGLPLAQRMGRCDVSAVVVNYADVEGAAKRINAIVAVAMEYSAPPGGGTRFTKFYTFVPDTRSGESKRVLSVNLDRRGEQFMPQACVVCHGGTPGTVSGQVYANGGNVNATFLPWDLDSFLYSDTDPGFSRKERNAGLRARYTRTQQEQQFKRLNEGAYLTYADPAGSTGRFALAKELLEKWYGGAGLPNANFDDTAVPAGWQAGVQGNPADAPAIYHNVFARNCRACHVMQVPLSGDPRTASVNVPGVGALTSCSNDSRLANTTVGVTSQVPMGCYWQFAHAPNLIDRLSRSDMPFARRTMDRLWTDRLSNGSTTGELLQAHLEATQQRRVMTPGMPTPQFSALPADVDIDGVVTLDSSGSGFLDNIEWTVAACTTTLPQTCTRELPMSGANGEIAKFTVDAVAQYQVTLVSASDGGSSILSSLLTVEDKPLVLVANPNVTFQIGGSGALPAVISTLGNGSLARHTMRLTPSSGFFVSPSTCADFSGCPATTAVSITSSAVTQTPGTIAVSVFDAGAEERFTTVSVLAQSTFAAQPLTLSSPLVQANDGSATSFNVLSIARAAVGRNDVEISALSYTGPRALTTTPTFNGTTLTFRPNAGFATHAPGAGGAQGAGTSVDTFSYTLQRSDTGEVSSSSITIPVHARVSFATMRATWGTAASPTSCSSGCHVGGGGPSFGTMTYSQIRNGFLTGATSRAYVSLSNVPQSGLMCWPKQNCSGLTVSHSGSTRLDSELDSIRQWMEDGANNF